MPHFPESELILTAEGRVYHLNLRAEDIADTVVLVGDQNRVQEVSKYFDHIRFKTAHREFITHTGTYKGKDITVISTGIGPDNIDIVLNELDAAVNIDPQSRELKAEQRCLNIFRLGTSGAIRKELPVDSVVLSTHGLGFDNLLHYYEQGASQGETALVEAFKTQVDWPHPFPEPYCYAADPALLAHFRQHAHEGITVTAPGFYGPQGRSLRLDPALKNLHERLRNFRFGNSQIANFEMETSALYGLGKLLGHRCLTLCVIIANRETLTFSKDTARSVERLIKHWFDKMI